MHLGSDLAQRRSNFVVVQERDLAVKEDEVRGEICLNLRQQTLLSALLVGRLLREQRRSLTAFLSEFRRFMYGIRRGPPQHLVIIVVNLD